MSKQTQSFTLLAFLRLTRFWNLLIIALAQYFTAIFLIDRGLLYDWRLVVVVVSTLFVAAAGYIINDYYDIKIDLINKPDRVVVGKNITRRYALFFHSVLSVFGVIPVIFLNWKIGIVNFISAFLLWWYSNNLKRQPFVGNFVVALLTGAAILLVSVMYRAYDPLIFIYAGFAFSMTLVREIVKDMEDLKGDNTFGCKTLPIVLGIRKTKWIIYTLLILFSTSVVWVNVKYSQLPDSYFLAFLFVPLGLLAIRLVRADTRKDFYWLSQACKVIMMLGILSMAFI